MKKKLLNLCFLFVLILPLNAIFGQGDLMITPKRLVFDGSQRSQEINLSNTGNDTAVYAISFVNYKMLTDGNFVEVDTAEAGQNFAEDFLRYFPRRVNLAPNEAQTIRVQVTRTGDLQEGEYRSHMYFRAVEEQSALGSEISEETEGIAINIKTVFGISIPIIIRQGRDNTEIQLENLQLDTTKEQPLLSLSIQRSGNMSVYGNFAVTHTAPNGKATEVGAVKGVSVYTPNPQRDFSFVLRNVEGIDLSTGRLEITYSEENGKALATAQLKL